MHTRPKSTIGLFSAMILALVTFACRFGGPVIQSLPDTQETQVISATQPDLAGSEDYDYSITFDGLERTFKVHVPAGYDPNSPMPLVIFLHGGGNNDSMHSDGLDKASETYKFIVVAPNGTVRLENLLLTWNAGTLSGGECCGYAVNNNINDVGFISLLIDDLKTKFNIDVKRVYATGISNGGMMTYRLACDLSNKIAAVAPVAPPAIPQDCVPEHPVSIIHIHDTADPCAPYNGGAGGGCLGSRSIAMSAQEMVDSRLKSEDISAEPTTI